jgi:hypothetical protein
MKDKQITDIVVNIIKRDHPNWWLHARKNSYKDDAGNRIWVRDDGICWESTSWVEYITIDEINDEIWKLGIEAEAEYSNSYEILINPY